MKQRSFGLDTHNVGHRDSDAKGIDDSLHHNKLNKSPSDERS